jgi:hypothetical protein
VDKNRGGVKKIMPTPICLKLESVLPGVHAIQEIYRLARGQERSEVVAMDSNCFGVRGCRVNHTQRLDCFVSSLLMSLCIVSCDVSDQICPELIRLVLIKNSLLFFISSIPETET